MGPNDDAAKKVAWCQVRAARATYPCSEQVDANGKKGAEPLNRTERTGFISVIAYFSTTLTFCAIHVLIARTLQVPTVEKAVRSLIFNVASKYRSRATSAIGGHR